MEKLRFSGHESFILKSFWLKKGYDFVASKKKFNDPDSVVELGVGKNMVASIQFWLKAVGVMEDEHDIQGELFHRIFRSDAYDPFIEDIGTVWLMHYFLVKTEVASIYSLFFNRFRKEKNDFTEIQLVNFMDRVCKETQTRYSLNTLKRDAKVLLRNYVQRSDSKVDIEEDYSRLFPDLNLIDFFISEDLEEKKLVRYSINDKARPTLPNEILLACILDYAGKARQSLSLRDLHSSWNSPGAVFALSMDSFRQRVNEIATRWPQYFLFSSTAGNEVLQIIEPLSNIKILDEYYQK